MSHGLALTLPYAMPKAGIVTVVGKPNAGKSTLLNRIVGEKLSIVSPKPQSTRDRVVGIRTSGDVQLIVLDTPGLLNPRYTLQEMMRGTALAALAEADVILYLVDGSDGTPRPLVEVAALDRAPRATMVVGVNKVDLIPQAQRDDIIAATRASVVTGTETLADVRLVSATTGEGVEELLATLGALLPESPFLYPEDDISTQTVRFFVRELVRETALEQLNEEVPYSVACEIEESREGSSPLYIRAVLHVERESQKGILIGAGAQRIREIGRAARQKIEVLVGSAVYLDLRVKVLPNWRRNTNALNRLGYKLPGESAS